MSDKDWLRAPCSHEWWFGPLMDKLMRFRPAVCVKCWDYRPHMDLTFFPRDYVFRLWGEEQYEQYKDEVERRFFSETVHDVHIVPPGD